MFTQLQRPSSTVAEPPTPRSYADAVKSVRFSLGPSGSSVPLLPHHPRSARLVPSRSSPSSLPSTTKALGRRVLSSGESSALGVLSVPDRRLVRCDCSCHRPPTPRPHTIPLPTDTCGSGWSRSDWPRDDWYRQSVGVTHPTTTAAAPTATRPSQTPIPPNTSSSSLPPSSSLSPRSSLARSRNNCPKGYPVYRCFWTTRALWKPIEDYGFTNSSQVPTLTRHLVDFCHHHVEFPGKELQRLHAAYPAHPKFVWDYPTERCRTIGCPRHLAPSYKDTWCSCNCGNPEYCPTHHRALPPFGPSGRFLIGNQGFPPRQSKNGGIR